MNQANERSASGVDRADAREPITSELAPSRSTLFSVRNSLLAISAITTVLLLWLITSFWVDAFKQRQDAERILRSTEFGAELLTSTYVWAAERVLTQVALFSPAPTTPVQMNDILDQRQIADQSFRAAIAGLRTIHNADQHEKLIAAIESHHQGLQAIRKQVDQQIAKPTDDRNEDVRLAWFQAITDLITEAARLKTATRYRPASSVADVETQLDVTHAVSVMSEFAERERAIIAGTIAADDPLILEDVQKLSIYRGHFDRAWRSIESHLIQKRVAKAVVDDIAAVRAGYFGDFEKTRTRIILAGMEGAEYPLTVAEWMARSSAAIGPIREIGTMAVMVADDLVSARAAHGARRLVIDTVILVIVIGIAGAALWIAIGQIAAPLDAITRTMTQLASGDGSVDVPGTDRRGEIGDMARAVQVFKDTVEQKAAEVLRANQDLQSLNDNLDELVRKRTAEAEAARDDAIEASQAKSVFLANMSHELRTPLNAIIGYSEILSEEAEDLGHKDYLPDLARIQKAGRHLLSLINDVLDLSKIEAGKTTVYFEDFDADQLINEVVATIGAVAEQNSNAVTVNIDGKLGIMHSDQTKIRQVLFNLLSNACKFTHEGTVTIHAARTSGPDAEAVDRISFSVTDTGIGMSQAQLDKVFDAFTQADGSTTREFGGTGLGLAITRSFCTILGGDVGVTSEQGEGSTFTVELPVDSRGYVSHQEGEMPDGDVVAKGVPGDARTVLVIDDDPVIRDLLGRHLTRNGYQAVLAGDGAAGLEMAQEIKPDAITLDVLMPKMDGWAVLSQLKDDPATADIPVIMVSIVDERRIGFSLGASDYVAKPVDRDKLLAVLQRLCPIRDRPRRVLVVEDDEATRDVMVRMLTSADWSVDQAENGRIGMDRLLAETPDAILLDLMMPVMDGFEFLIRMRENDNWAEVPVIVVTAKELTEDDRVRLDGRMEQLIQKGAHLDEVLSTLNRMLPQSISARPGGVSR